MFNIPNLTIPVKDLLNFIGILISLIALVFSYKAKKNSEASIENNIHSSLSHAEEKYLDVAYGTKKMSEASYLEHTKLSLLNQYDILCAQYLNNRVNKKEFMVNYELAIKSIVESESFDVVHKCWVYYPNLEKVYTIIKENEKR